MPMRRFVNGDWNRELYNRFLRHAAVEMEEEGPVAYVVTWLLQEHRQPSCWTPRVVKLTEDHTAWSDLIVTAWQDLFDYNQLCEAHWVHPTPAQSSFSTTIGHIILEQNVNDQLASIVITTPISSPRAIHRSSCPFGSMLASSTHCIGENHSLS